MIAIPLYPSGNMLDSTQIGYDFSRNYLSELSGYKTQSGETNFFSAFFFNLGFFCAYVAGEQDGHFVNPD